MPTTRELRAAAKARKIPKYYKLNKSQLLQQLGMRDELKAHKLSKGKGDAIKAQAQKLSDGDVTDRARIKGRMTRAIARELRKTKGELSQEQKREIALKAIKREAKRIKEGISEQRGGKVRKGEKVSPAEQKRARKIADKARADRQMGKVYRDGDDGVIPLDPKARSLKFTASKTSPEYEGASVGAKKQRKWAGVAAKEAGASRYDKGPFAEVSKPPKQSEAKAVEVEVVEPKRKKSIGDRIREQTAELRKGDEVAKQAVSRILAASAQIAKNQDNLIDEVVQIATSDPKPKKQRRSAQRGPIDRSGRKLRFPEKPTRSDRGRSID